jgi:hypothetical protein
LVDALLIENSDILEDASLQSSANFVSNGIPFSLDLSISHSLRGVTVDEVVDEGREV